MTHLFMENEDLLMLIDPNRGADILSIKFKPTNAELLFSTPWRERADAIAAGLQNPISTDPVVNWMEQYRGGWQTLCPNAGSPRNIHGSLVGFHGEASVVPWKVISHIAGTVRMSVELFTVPIRIDREISLNGPRILLRDTITNLSEVDLNIDYSSHPAFGGDLLFGHIEITTGALSFTLDPESDGVHGEPGSTHSWPFIRSRIGGEMNISKLPAPPESASLFGWLSDFKTKSYQIHNIDSGLAVELSWESDFLEYAWFWVEFNSSATSPWFKQARTFAIEPSSTQTSGINRKSKLEISALSSCVIVQRLSITS
jgi:galactose mutarotase-like enzyme